MKHAEIIGQMTLVEKCALLSGKDVWHTREVERLGVPSLTLSDGPSGLRKQAAKGDHLGLNVSTEASCLPSASLLACGWDAALPEQMGDIVGTEAAEQEVHQVLGPGLNTKRSPLCGRNFEYYSEDPYLSGKLAAGFIRGVQSRGVGACAKHFAANSQELLRMHSDSVVDERTLRELYLTNFEIAVKEGKPQAVMSAYNRLNGVYVNEDAHLLRDILRGEWGFDGMVVTDWGGSNSFVAGVRAGMNLEMPAAGDDSPCQLLRAVEAGEVSEAVVDTRVDELLDWCLMERTTGASPALSADERHEAIRTAAEKCMVLLKNENQILPLAHEVKVAVIGDFAAHPHYQGGGSSMVNAPRVDDTLSLLDEYFPREIGYAQGFTRAEEPNDELLQQAVALAERAECVLLYLGLFETEGLDREHMRLPENQLVLLKRLSEVNPHVIVVLASGSPVETPWLTQCEALLYAGLGGEAAADAVLRVLSGAACPAGKLAETWYRRYEDAPVGRYYPGRESTAEYREGLYVGYRYTETVNAEVTFPFGFGLSYTTFAYENAELSDTGVSFDILNTGSVAGDEIAQLYVSKADSMLPRPAMELKGFGRVHLEAGERKRILIPFDVYTFRYFNVKTHEYEVEGGEYGLHIGACVRDIRLTAIKQMQGTADIDPYEGLSLPSYQSGQVADVSDAEFEALLGRSLPQSRWDRTKLLGMNDTVSQLFYAKNPIARLVCHVFQKKIEKAEKLGTPDLNLLFMYNIPFRGMGKMMNGMMSMAMAEDVLLIVNGHFFKGVGRLLWHFLHRPKLPQNAQTKG